MYFKHLKALVTVLFKSFSNMTPLSIFIFQNALMHRRHDIDVMENLPQLLLRTIENIVGSQNLSS